MRFAGNGGLAPHAPRRSERKPRSVSSRAHLPRPENGPLPLWRRGRAPGSGSASLLVRCGGSADDRVGLGRRRSNGRDVVRRWPSSPPSFLRSFEKLVDRTLNLRAHRPALSSLAHRERGRTAPVAETPDHAGQPEQRPIAERSGARKGARGKTARSVLPRCPAASCDVRDHHGRLVGSGGCAPAGARGNLARFPLALSFHARKMGRCFFGGAIERRDLVRLRSSFGVGASRRPGRPRPAQIESS
jgi:hypothetical protein